MKPLIAVLALLAAPVLAQQTPALQNPGETLDPALDRARYEGCIRAIQTNATKAEQFALEWQLRGGGLPARHCQALAQLQQQNYPAAAATLARAAQAAEAQKSPLVADFWGQAGNAAFLAGDSKGAAGYFTSAITAAGPFAPQRTAALLIDRARVHADAQDLPAARADLDKALALNANDSTAWLLSAALARRQGDLPRARLEIARAVALNPADADVLFEGGNIAAMSGDQAAARRHWEAALKAGPGTQAAELAGKALAAN
ncbi:MAG: tetratricopeptide repeat protein [Sandaracinobacteroides sp.]